MYVQCKIEVRLYNSYLCQKAISITYSECVFVALGIQNARRMRHIIICDLTGSNVFLPHIINSMKKCYLT